MRTYDLTLITKAVAQYADQIDGFDPDEWTDNYLNVALTNDNEDIALFERQELNPVAVFGHYFFWSRGKDAVKAAKQFLEEIFTGGYNVEVIVGLTPVEHKGALWLNRQLGFVPLDIINSRVGDLQMVVLTKNDWENK